jgi:multisubunit Na+/H+ antiporter MnhF subunit
MEHIAIVACAVALAACFGGLFWRFLRGPTQLDRVAVIEKMGAVMLCAVALWGLHAKTHWFYDVVLVLAVTGWLGTVILAKWIEKGDPIDH